MPKVGSQSSSVSPGETNSLTSRSISSPLPAPATMRLSSNPVCADRAALTLRWSGSG